MALRTADDVANARLDAIESTVGVSAILEIFGGTKPATIGAADATPKLVTMNLPSDWLAAASARSKAKAGTWSGTGLVAGYATHFRLKTSGGVVKMDGDLGEPWAASKAYVLNQQVVNGGNVYKCTTAGTSAASGGPTGTGTGITDSTAVWAYVNTADMTLDNTNIALNQSVAVNTFTLTDGN
jgi:hypothetical protein